MLHWADNRLHILLTAKYREMCRYLSVKYAMIAKGLQITLG